MALPGVGFRTVGSMMIEISLALIEDFVWTTLTTSVPVPGLNTVIVGLLGINRNAVYVGARLIVDVGVNQEIVTVTAVNPAANSFDAAFNFAHPIGTLVQGATFPVQAASGDPLFMQTEIQNYIARAQHDFLMKVPVHFRASTQFAEVGQIYQQLPCDTIELAKVSSSTMNVALAVLDRTSNVVTAESMSPHGMIPGQKFSVYNVPDPSFVGAFTVASVIDAVTITYTQYAPDATVPDATGGSLILWKRLYLTDQESLYMQNPFWRNQNITEIRSVYEDRTGNYRMGIDGKLSVRAPLEILVSIRDTDVLEMSDSFLVPDLCLHFVRYKALEYCFEKDGEQRDPLRAKYCKMRFDRGVLATRRWLDNVVGDQVPANKAAMTR